jgi:integrase
MPLRRQAKTFTKAQGLGILGHLDRTRHPARNKVIFLLSAKAGLRAKEIASLTWEMLTEADGTIGGTIRLEDKASKGRSGRVIPMNQVLRNALIAWRSVQNRVQNVRVCRLDRAVSPHQSPGHREPILPLVPRSGIPGLLQP